MFAFDTETDSLDYMVANLVGLSFATEEGVSLLMFQLRMITSTLQNNLDRDWVLEQLKPILEDDAQAKVGQNLKYDASVS